MKRSTINVGLVACAATAAALAGSAIGEAHKAVTSKYSYNEDVFPILKAKCGACHVAGGIAPMSLLTYEEAFPWGESIRAELIAARMPPWNAEGGFGRFKHAQTLTPKEIDIILTWATGGNPQGDRTKTPEPVTREAVWPLGPPDTAIPLPEPVTVPAGEQETIHEFTVALNNPEPRWVRAIDLLPDSAVMVRSATIAIAAADGTTGPVVTHWLPGGTTVAVEGAPAFRLPAQATLAVHVRYKKTWMYDSQALTDRSTIGLYDARPGDHRAIEALTISSDPLVGQDTVTFTTTLDRDVDVFAITPGHMPPHGGLQVEGVLADGTRVPMIRVNTRPSWTRRYWFEQPISLPRGARVEVSTNLETPFTLPLPDLLAPPEPPQSNDPLSVTLDVAPHGGAHASGQ